MDKTDKSPETPPETIDPQAKDALALEEEGDRLLERELCEEALARYRQAEAANPHRVEIYQKLLLAHEKCAAHADWQEQDMAEVLGWTMRAQELASPRMKYLHHQLSGDGNDVAQLLDRLMQTQDVEEEKRLLETIEALGAEALPALLYFFLSIKRAKEGHLP